jgi:hypothetical protein
MREMRQRGGGDGGTQTAPREPGPQLDLTPVQILVTVARPLHFRARDGRFRITQTGIEMFNDMGGGWQPIGKWTGSPWKKAEATFTACADAVAQCVIAGSKRADW